jgi:hypothetical protein
MAVEAANLQKMTAKQIAKKLAISERQLHKAGEIMRYRPDLGRLSHLVKGRSIQRGLKLRAGNLTRHGTGL